MHSEETKSPYGFPSTHWSRVHLASNHEEEAGSQALADLLKRYRPALLKHLGKFDLSPADREDCLSRFLADKILAQKLLQRADPAKGRFRNLLLSALDSVALDQFRSQSRKKRRPTGGFVPFESSHEEAVQNTHTSPDRGDLAWAKLVIQQARERTERFYRQKDRAETWAVFLEGCYQPLYQAAPTPAHSDLAKRHGFPSTRHVSNTITTAKRRFGDFLRDVVREYEVHPGAVDEEIRELIAIVSQGR